MAQILNIETATTNCSVGVAKDGVIMALKEDNSPNYSHSEQLHRFIEEVLADAGLNFSDLDAIAVSKGPGSYTGLRIGVSAAKGLCFSLDLPLIAIPTLESMAQQATKRAFIIPMLDARRMEVYAAVFDQNLQMVRETRAEIIDDHSFEAFIQKGEVLFLGSGAQKCKEVLSGPNIYFNSEAVPSAREMAALSYRKFLTKKFEDVAYFEPLYLKDFLITKKQA
ncbi:MAG: tRNA (adenosine(37)-N6)-threonylcarbamoyltransferase complex dimerization subunit type 1 TsaB [Flavobacteriales bacterium]|nr:MAG: tRNA (adenosine(37)-N6)-threonylcarbamoyltransferase complex dimerization subunit type 1 TsaB [Flavobacteriales bacterium]